jgi:hypothetical protein
VAEDPRNAWHLVLVVEGRKDVRKEGRTCVRIEGRTRERTKDRDDVGIDGIGTGRVVATVVLVTLEVESGKRVVALLVKRTEL